MASTSTDIRQPETMEEGVKELSEEQLREIINVKWIEGPSDVVNQAIEDMGTRLMRWNDIKFGARTISKGWLIKSLKKMLTQDDIRVDVEGKIWFSSQAANSFKECQEKHFGEVLVPVTECFFGKLASSTSIASATPIAKRTRARTGGVRYVNQTDGMGVDILDHNGAVADSVVMKDDGSFYRLEWSDPKWDRDRSVATIPPFIRTNTVLPTLTTSRQVMDYADNIIVGNTNPVDLVEGLRNMRRDMDEMGIDPKEELVEQLDDILGRAVEHMTARENDSYKEKSMKDEKTRLAEIDFTTLDDDYAEEGAIGGTAVTTAEPTANDTLSLARFVQKDGTRTRKLAEDDVTDSTNPDSVRTEGKGTAVVAAHTPKEGDGSSSVIPTEARTHGGMVTSTVKKAAEDLETPDISEVLDEDVIDSDNEYIDCAGEEDEEKDIAEMMQDPLERIDTVMTKAGEDALAAVLADGTSTGDPSDRIIGEIKLPDHRYPLAPRGTYESEDQPTERETKKNSVPPKDERRGEALMSVSWEQWDGVVGSILDEPVTSLPAEIPGDWTAGRLKRGVFVLAMRDLQKLRSYKQHFLQSVSVREGLEMNELLRKYMKALNPGWRRRDVESTWAEGVARAREVYPDPDPRFLCESTSHDMVGEKFGMKDLPIPSKDRDRLRSATKTTHEHPPPSGLGTRKVHGVTDDGNQPEKTKSSKRVSNKDGDHTDRKNIERPKPKRLTFDEKVPYIPSHPAVPSYSSDMQRSGGGGEKSVKGRKKPDTNVDESSKTDTTNPGTTGQKENSGQVLKVFQEWAKKLQTSARKKDEITSAEIQSMQVQLDAERDRREEAISRLAAVNERLDNMEQSRREERSRSESSRESGKPKGKTRPIPDFHEPPKPTLGASGQPKDASTPKKDSTANREGLDDVSNIGANEAGASESKPDPNLAASETQGKDGEGKKSGGNWIKSAAGEVKQWLLDEIRHDTTVRPLDCFTARDPDDLTSKQVLEMMPEFADNKEGMTWLDWLEKLDSIRENQTVSLKLLRQVFDYRLMGRAKTVKSQAYEKLKLRTDLAGKEAIEFLLAHLSNALFSEAEMESAQDQLAALKQKEGQKIEDLAIEIRRLGQRGYPIKRKDREDMMARTLRRAISYQSLRAHHAAMRLNRPDDGFEAQVDYLKKLDPMSWGDGPEGTRVMYDVPKKDEYAREPKLPLVLREKEGRTLSLSMDGYNPPDDTVSLAESDGTYVARQQTTRGNQQQQQQTGRNQGGHKRKRGGGQNKFGSERGTYQSQNVKPVEPIPVDVETWKKAFQEQREIQERDYKRLLDFTLKRMEKAEKEATNAKATGEREKSPRRYPPPKVSSQRRTRAFGERGGGPPFFNRGCFKCGQEGHFARRCPQNQCHLCDVCWVEMTGIDSNHCYFCSDPEGEIYFATPKSGNEGGYLARDGQVSQK